MAQYTPKTWAATLLARLGIKQTPGAMQALVGWQRAEGGHWNNSARYNPLNTTQPAPGSSTFRSVGQGAADIRIYNSWDQGLDATVQTLRNGHYGGILRALRSGHPGAVANAIGSSPWGTRASLVSQAIGGTAPTSARPVAGGSSGGSPGGQAHLAYVPGSVAASLGLQQQQPQKPAVPVTAPTAPSFAAQAPLPGAARTLQGPQTSQDISQPRFDSGAALEALQTLQRQQAVGPSSRLVASQTQTQTGGGQGAPRNAKKVGYFEGKEVAGWIAPILKRAKATGLWHGTVNSGYRSDAEQTHIYQSGVRPAALPKSMGGSGSNHEGLVYPLGAVDVSDAAGLAAALRKIGATRLQYAGSKDPVHFSHPHNGGY